MVSSPLHRKSLSQKDFRPTFDRLEDRLALAIITVNTLTDVNNGNITGTPVLFNF